MVTSKLPINNPENKGFFRYIKRMEKEMVIKMSVTKVTLNKDNVRQAMREIKPCKDFSGKVIDDLGNRRFTNEDLARGLGYANEKSVSQYLSGKPIKLERVRELSKVLNCSVDYLIGYPNTYLSETDREKTISEKEKKTDKALKALLAEYGYTIEPTKLKLADGIYSYDNRALYPNNNYAFMDGLNSSPIFHVTEPDKHFYFKNTDKEILKNEFGTFRAIHRRDIEKLKAQIIALFESYIFNVVVEEEKKK